MNILKNIFTASLYVLGTATAIAFSAGMLKAAHDVMNEPPKK